MTTNISLYELINWVIPKSYVFIDGFFGFSKISSTTRDSPFQMTWKMVNNYLIVPKTLESLSKPFALPILSLGDKTSSSGSIGVFSRFSTSLTLHYRLIRDLSLHRPSCGCSCPTVYTTVASRNSSALENSLDLTPRTRALGPSTAPLRLSQSSAPLLSANLAFVPLKMANATWGGRAATDAI